MCIDNKIFISRLKDDKKFIGFCEILSNLDNNIILLKESIFSNIEYIINDIYELNLSDLNSIDIGNIDKKILIINIDELDDNKLLNLNFSREILIEKFEKILIISNSEEVSNRFISVSKDLFSWIQYHFNK